MAIEQRGLECLRERLLSAWSKGQVDQEIPPAELRAIREELELIKPDAHDPKLRDLVRRALAGCDDTPRASLPPWDETADAFWNLASWAGLQAALFAAEATARAHAAAGGRVPPPCVSMPEGIVPISAGVVVATPEEGEKGDAPRRRRVEELDCSSSSSATRVFVSYTWEDGPHNSLVAELVDDLRDNGVDARFDKMVNGTPPEGWPRWMEEQIAAASFVLVVSTETYLRRYELREEPGRGRGASWEGAIIRQEMYEDAASNTKFAAVLFSDDHEKYKPAPLRPHTHYVYPKALTELLRWLTAQPAYVPRPLGKVPDLPPV